jgi:dGTPase
MDGEELPLRKQRIHSSPDKNDNRNPFERDRDRILYSRAFRRLAEVTQVVQSGESHTYHNRLTHSLKVAQVGRRLAEYLLSKHSDDGGDPDRELLDSVGGLNPDVVETAALAHDLGHPPFGHIAEIELDRILTEENGVIDGFEGNVQSFRIVNRVATHSEIEEY